MTTYPIHSCLAIAVLHPSERAAQGTLSHLDSKNPVMHIEFPNGRLKLLGTLVFPKSKYIVLKVASGHMLCEDVFESMVRTN